MNKRAKAEQGPRTNRAIRVSPIRLIGKDGEQLGVIETKKAFFMAQDEGLDLVEVQPNARPPVCKIIDYGKYKYELKKKKKEAKKNQTVVLLKEIKFRPKTDTHDFEVKVKKILSFLDEGNKVKVTIMFRGREMKHTDIGSEILQKVAEEVSDIAKVETRPSMESRNMSMMLSLDKSKAEPK